MKISILIAARQADAHLAGALASLKDQVHTAWELIVAEYGTAGQTEQIVREFALSVSQSVHYHGLAETDTAGAARNHLLDLATGDPVAFLEPLDTWSPRHLANATTHLDAGADLVISDIRFFDPSNRRPAKEVATPAQLINNPVRALFSRDAIPSPSSVVMRRSVAEHTGAFDPRFRISEGRDFWLRAALASARFAASQRTTCQCPRSSDADPARALLLAEDAVLFYEKHRDLAAVPAALRRRLLANSLVAHGRLLRASDPARAARCFWRAWSLQPVYVQTLGQFALTGWRSGSVPPPPPEPRRPSQAVDNEPVTNGQ